MGSNRTTRMAGELGGTVFCRMNKTFIFYMEKAYPKELASFFEQQQARLAEEGKPE